MHHVYMQKDKVPAAERAYDHLKRRIIDDDIDDSEMLSEAALAAGTIDAVAFGAPYLSNPDLVDRLRRNVALAPVPPEETWYGGDEEGYLDFPLADAARE